MALNKVMLIGNVGKDPDVRNLEGGSSVASFTLATSERYKDKNGESKEVTEWHNIVAWRQLADLASNYIRKGSQIYVEGRLRSRSWLDQSGVKHYVTEIVADTIQLLGRRDSGQVPSGSSFQEPSPQRSAAPQVSSAPAPVEDSADDLPF